ncbi:tRNA(Met) cytidine acetyltransferase [Colwellia sp. MB02u-10]|uniref:GNAT family N-acetyltransferase n=1 Tax=Colwellia sp. MB02u-10 TaxID=2759828 RepID=UPI0015F41581|nr:GNAT family N-acetyltransferase [Colwellia sp. MB02u-10]MBA6340872.1 tRNA(Met) cytidine acetyltransferase [Colwellia sp. MB02u-10]
MSKESFSHWCLQLKKQNQAKRWRSLVVLVGNATWTTEQLETSLTLFLSAKESNEKLDKQGLVYGELAHASRANQLISVNRKNYAQYLGTEQDVIVFAVESKADDNDACHVESDFDVDAFAALSGTLVAGGVFLLLLKPSQVEQVNQVQSQDYFLKRFMLQLAAEHGYLIRQDKAEFPALFSFNKAAQDNRANEGQLSTAQQIKNLPYGCITQEQVLAVKVMLKVLSGHRDRPLVLTADRGRGKSSALALAACQMLANAKQPLKIIITAASKSALKVFFQQVETHLPDAKVGMNSVEHANGSIVFYAIDVLLKEQPEASIVMVDEAAALPVYLLQQLLSHYHRLIFATTIHGYEGAGRGFSLKFALVLQRLMPNWRKMHINEAIRWASDDPLEQFVFASCLLNAKLPNYPNTFLAMNNAIPEIKRESKREIKSEAKVGAESIANNVQAQSDLLSQYKLVTELVTPTQLLQNETLLQQVFAVLVTAHYQTSPSDLKLLLNNSAISLFVLKHENDILGVVMLMREGHADEKLVELIRENQRRLRDQFLPQSLLMHCGIKESFNYSYQRVMRIAIHPQFQGQGLGRHFLSAIERHITRQGINFIGASFAGNATLLKFWQQAGFAVARVGFSKDKASGEHSCLVTKALTFNASHLQQVIVEQFYQQFDYWLTDEFTHMPAKLVWQLLKGNTTLKTSVLARDILQSVNDFTSGQRQFSSCVYALHQWLLKHCTEQFNPEVLPLVARILQKHSIDKVCQQYAFTGKKSLNQHLIKYIKAHQALAHTL